MFLKPLKVKARNGMLFDLNYCFRNDNYVALKWNWYNFGIGVEYSLGDIRRFLDINFMWISFELWF